MQPNQERQKPWGQSHRPPVPPRPEKRRRRHRHHSKLGWFFMIVGFVTVGLTIFRFLIVPLLVWANGGA